MDNTVIRKTPTKWAEYGKIAEGYNINPHGLDVSSHQGDIDWPLVAAAGYEFVFIRCSRGNIPDSHFERNFAGAQSAGLLVAPYHVVYDKPTPQEQIEFFLSRLPERRDFPLVLDVETEPKQTVLDNTRQMVELLHDYHVVIYTGAWWWDTAIVGQNVQWAKTADLWTASYTNEPIIPARPWDDWTIWQYTSSGSVLGIEGRVDMNEYNGTDLYSWWGKTLVIELTEPAKLFVGNDLVLELVPTQPAVTDWAYPVGNTEYPPEDWYAASIHDPTGQHGTAHIGLDLNLDKAPWGDIERTLGLNVYAVADGVVTYVTDSWSGVPMIVIQHEHDGAPLWVRYAHIIPVVSLGQTVKAGDVLGPFADWRTGDHLHFDMATEKYEREYLGTDIAFIDPVPVLKMHLDSYVVNEMLKRD